MNISEKIKIINKRIQQNKAQYDLDRRVANIFALLSGDVSKYKFLTGKDIFPKTNLLEEVAAMKRFGYSPLRKELKVQNDIAKN